jgi:hypothetical protein
MKPARLTRIWAGLGQLHEVGHLHDWAEGGESPNSSGREWAGGEIRAHRVELECPVSIVFSNRVRTRL